MTDEQKLKEIYLMDRAIRALNDEDALYNSGWLYEVEDEVTDNGFDAFKAEDESNFTSYADDYMELKSLYASIMNEYSYGGIISADFYKGKDGYKVSAGADQETLDFVLKDYPDIEIIGKSEITESISPEEYLKDKTCCICGKHISNFGNNADPVCDGRCCDACNDSVVVPYRIYLAYGGTKLDNIEDIKKITSQISL